MLRLQTLGGIALEADGALPTGGPRRRRLALLALVATGGRRGIGRDRVIAILWPDSPSEQARHALSQTLYALRRDLQGKEAIILGPELRLDPAVITTDLDTFRAAVAARDWSGAAAAYRGPFLDGFVLPDVPEFDRWVEDERRGMASEARQAFEAAAADASGAGRLAEAVEYWRRLAGLDPLSSRFALGLTDALAATGDRAGAIAHARQYGDLVRRELEIEPDPAVEAAIARLRPAATGATTTPVPPAPTQAAPSPPPPADTAPPARRAPSRWIAAVVGLVVIGVAAAALAARGFRREPVVDRPPILAVGDLRDLTAPDSAATGVLGEILSTSLARLTNLEVVATSRMLELLPRGEMPIRAARLEAARRAGAAEVLEGELSSVPGGMLRLDLRRVDVASGVVRRGYVALAGDRWAAVDSITSSLASDLALAAPSEPIETRSPAALRLYEDGLRALYQYDTFAAARNFGAAIAEDSTFALAAYYGWWSAALIGDASAPRLQALALRLADRAPARERLLIRTHVGSSEGDPASVAAAESLLARYPRDPEALIRASQTLSVAGRPLERITPLLERAIAIDSAATGGRTGPCRLCESFAELAEAFERADSIRAVLATLDRWAALVPEDPRASTHLAGYALRIGRDDLWRRATERQGRAGRQPVDSIEGLLQRGVYLADVRAMERGCAAAFALEDDRGWSRYRRDCATALRMMGRFRAAAAMVSEGRAPSGGARRSGAPRDPFQMAVLDLEMSRPLLAADYFVRAARAAADSSPGSRAWLLTLAAVAAIEAADTVMAGRLADSLGAAAGRGGGSDQLQRFVRGLLDASRGDHVAALDRFRSAVSSWNLGFTRVNYEIAASALALGRPAEAIYPLQAALRGRIDGPQLLLNRALIHERLAQAFDAAGQTDSAAYHYGRVTRLWQGADPVLAERYETARRWLTQRGRPVP